MLNHGKVKPFFQRISVIIQEFLASFEWSQQYLFRLKLPLHFLQTADMVIWFGLLARLTNSIPVPWKL